MPDPQELPSLDEAFDTAADEQGFSVDADDRFVAEQPVGKTSEPGAAETAEQETATPDETDQSVFGDLAETEEAAPPPDLWATEVELPGFDRPVKLADVRDGYMRQADYSRKTQALAEERKAFAEEHSQALKLMEALAKDPAGTAAYLAVQTKVIDESQVDASRVRGLQDVWKPPPSREEIQAEVERRIAEGVQAHPAVLQAQQQVLIAEIDADFVRIEQKHGLKLSDRDRAAILKRAIDSHTPDLDLVTESMLRRLDKVRQDRDLARGAAGQRPTVRSPSADTPAKVESIEDAFNLALQESG